MIGSAAGRAGEQAQARRPRPLSELPATAWAGVLGLMTDIDDTLTRDGAIEPVALQALERLQQAGVPVIAITGRPHGWSLPFAARWPVRAIVAENGAVALMADGDQVQTEFVQDEDLRAHNLLRLQAVAQQIVQQVPGAHLARDSAGRLTDIAIDHSEFQQLSPAAIAQVVALMQAAGLTATVSSIHVNGWIGNHNKWTGAQWMLQRLFGRRLDDEVERWVYVGDSTNDQLMFDHFVHSVGVANLMDFADALTRWPTWLAAGDRGQGFAQVAEGLLAARGPVSF
jgi:HAD superfamily hydrolase (TIGR01484 family)